MKRKVAFITLTASLVFGSAMSASAFTAEDFTNPEQFFMTSGTVTDDVSVTIPDETADMAVKDTETAQESKTSDEDIVIQDAKVPATQENADAEETIWKGKKLRMVAPIWDGEDRHLVLLEDTYGNQGYKMVDNGTYNILSDHGSWTYIPDENYTKEAEQAAEDIKNKKYGSSIPYFDIDLTKYSNWPSKNASGTEETEEVDQETLDRKAGDTSSSDVVNNNVMPGTYVFTLPDEAVTTEDTSECEMWTGVFRNDYRVRLELNKATGQYTLTTIDDNEKSKQSMSNKFTYDDDTVVLHNGDGYAVVLDYIDENSLYGFIDGYEYRLTKESETPDVSDCYGSWRITKISEHGEAANVEDVNDIDDITADIHDGYVSISVMKSDGSRTAFTTNNVETNDGYISFKINNPTFGINADGVQPVIGQAVLQSDGTLLIRLTFTDNAGGRTVTMTMKKNAENAY